MIRQLIIIMLVFLYSMSLNSFKLHSQSANDFKINGFLSGGGDLYSISGFENRRSPYAYYLRGGLNFSYKSFSLPVNINYSNQQFSYGYALNRIGISPTYKWIKGHIGWSSMEFSPLVMNRKQFLGLGVELKPGIWTFQGFAGRFENPAAVRDTVLYGAILIPNFRRNAFGVNIGVGKLKNKINLSLLSVQDDLNTLLNNDNSSLRSMPQDNLVGGLGFRITPLKGLTLESDLAASILTNNKNSQELILEEAQFLQSLITPTLSTQISGSAQTKLRYSFKNISLGTEYRRIEPRYRSFGLPFMQNDIQTISAFTNMALFKSKIMLNVQVGHQSNNLRNNRAFTTTRLVSNLNLNWRVTDQFIGNVIWTNFVNDTEPGLLELSDTLRFTMVSDNMGVALNYRKKDKKDRWNFSLSANRQTLQDLSLVNRLNNDIANYQITIAGGKKLDDQGLHIKGSAMYSKFDGSFKNQKRYGGNIGLDKLLFKDKINLGFSTRFFINDVDEFSNGYVFTGQTLINYAIDKKQSLNWRTLYINKKSYISNNYSEIRSGLAYSIRF